MKAAEMLECPRCGAPVEAIARFCTFCGAPLAPTPAAVLHDAERRNLQRAAFCEELAMRLAQNVSPREAMRAASQAKLDAPFDDGVIHATIAIATDFEKETKCSVLRDANVLVRIAESYERARGDVRAHGSATLNLPFLGVTSSGPQHLSRDLTPASLAALEARS